METTWINGQNAPRALWEKSEEGSLDDVCRVVGGGGGWWGEERGVGGGGGLREGEGG